jgi:hypothetical protein
MRYLRIRNSATNEREYSQMGDKAQMDLEDQKGIRVHSRSFVADHLFRSLHVALRRPETMKIAVRSPAFRRDYERFSEEVES